VASAGDDDGRRKRQQPLGCLLRIVAEPGGATALAGLLYGGYMPAPGERVGVVICGGNTTAVDFEESESRSNV